MRGSDSFESIIKIERCSPVDWILIAVFLVICVVDGILAIILIRHNQGLKLDFKRGLVESDLIFNRKNIITLFILGFFGGVLSGALGLGGGVLFNPIFLALGVPPRVAASTGMFMIMFSTFSSSVIYVIQGTLNIEFGLWLGFFTAIGSIIGLAGIDSLIKRFDRQSLIVFAFCFIMLLCVITIPSFGYISLKEQVDNGEITYWGLGSIC